MSCIKTGYIQKLIQDRAFEREKQIQSGQKPVVGVNCFSSQKTESIQLSAMDPGILERQKRGLEEIKARRDQAAVGKALDTSEEGSRSRGESDAVRSSRRSRRYATVGEITYQLREVFGEYRETEMA